MAEQAKAKHQDSRLTLGSTPTGGVTDRAKSCPMIAAFVQSRYFESGMLLVILFNCITMGIEAEQLLGYASRWKHPVEMSEHFFTAAFCFELLLKVYVYGIDSMMPCTHAGSIWSFLDAILVFVTGIVAVWIMPIAGWNTGSEFRLMQTLRAIRMFRLVRVLRGIVAFKDVWLLLQGLVESSRTLVWVIAVIFFLTYIFAVFGVVLIGADLKEKLKADPDNEDLARLQRLADGLGTFMLLLIQVLTLDSWNAVVRPMMVFLPWVCYFFLAYIAIAVLVLMNLVTAVIVDNALQASKKNEEMAVKMMELEKKRQQAVLEKLFLKIDSDGDGYLSEHEFKDSIFDPVIGPKLQLLGCSQDDCMDIFELCDMAGDEMGAEEEPTLSIHEFLTNFSKMNGPAQSRDLLVIQKQICNLKHVIEGVSSLLSSETMTGVGPSPSGPRSPSVKSRHTAHASSPAHHAHHAHHAVPAESAPLLRATGHAQEDMVMPTNMEEFYRNLQDISFQTKVGVQKLDKLTKDLGTLHASTEQTIANSLDEVIQKMEVIQQVATARSFPTGRSLNSQAADNIEVAAVRQDLAAFPSLRLAKKTETPPCLSFIGSEPFQ